MTPPAPAFEAWWAKEGYHYNPKEEKAFEEVWNASKDYWLTLAAGKAREIGCLEPFSSRIKQHGVQCPITIAEAIEGLKG